MAPRRFILVITDELGSHRGRLRISLTPLRAGLVVFICFGVLLLGLTAHGMAAHRAVGQAAVTAAHNTAMHGLVLALEHQKETLDAVLAENHRALVLLSRKSHLKDATALIQADNEACPRSDPALAADLAATLDPVNPWAEPSRGQALLGRAEALIAQGTELESALSDLLEYWRDAEQRLTYTPSIRPARSPWTSSSYGVRIDPIFHYWVMHKGLDLAGFIGMLVYAPADGIVIWTGTRGGYGQVVVIDHGMGLQTHYAHLSRYLVHRGETVRRGDPIAQMGSTGKSTGPHLHYEVRQDGVPMDPRRFILD